MHARLEVALDPSLSQLPSKFLSLLSLPPSHLVRLVDDGEGDAEAEALEVADLLGELDDLGQEVHLEPQLAPLARLGALQAEVKFN